MLKFRSKYVPLLFSMYVGHSLKSAECQQRALAATPDLRHYLSWLSQQTHAFPVSGDRVHVIETPQQFYSTLTEKAKNAKHRVVLASLYLGSGSQEKALVADLCEARSRGVHVHVLLDWTRASRGPVSSRDALLPLVAQANHSAQVSLYHSPQLRGWWKLLLGEKVNELVGLQHIKAYVFDDDLVISGANLSQDYFTNRQDRYVCVEGSAPLADYYTRLIGAVGEFSFTLRADNSLQMPDTLGCHPYKGFDRGRKFIAVARDRVLSVIQPPSGGVGNTDASHQPIVTGSRVNHQPVRPGLQDNHQPVRTGSELNSTACRESTGRQATSVAMESVAMENEAKGSVANESVAMETDTVVYPLVQLGPLGVGVDREATLRFLQHCPPGSRLGLASGYFNLVPEYARALLGECGARVTVYTASPEANGFLTGAFPLHHIPAMYTHLSRHFLLQVRHERQQHRVQLLEYRRPGWTFHAKGLWYTPPGSDRPTITFVGSPNFGYRSVHRDLESQLVISTANPRLQHQLQQEEERLAGASTPVTETSLQQPDRLVPLYVRLAAILARSIL